MRLDLTKPKRRELRITLRNGSECVLPLRRVPLKDLDMFEERSEEISSELKSGKIKATEFYFQILEHRCEGFKREMLDDCDEFDLTDIMQKVTDLRMGKADSAEDAEKKS